MKSRSKTSEPTAPIRFDFFETEHVTLAFAGAAGSLGVFISHKGASSGWAYHPCGSESWNYFHQAAYRTFRADPVPAQQTIATLPPLPPLPKATSVASVKATRRADSAIRAGPLFDKVNAAPKRRLPVFYVLRDDLYEARFGDGRFIDLDAAFFNESEAREWIERHADKMIVHTLRSVELVIRRERLVVDGFRSGSFETASEDQLLEALTCRLEGKHWPTLPEF